MKRYVFTQDDRAKGNAIRRAYNEEGREARRMRRMGELALLDKLLAEASMPEWYPER